MEPSHSAGETNSDLFLILCVYNYIHVHTMFSRSPIYYTLCTVVYIIHHVVCKEFYVQYVYVRTSVSMERKISVVDQ